MLPLVILNGISRKRGRFNRRILPVLRKEFGVDVVITQHAGHAETLAAQASREGRTIIISAGGDGTMSQVINGVMNSGVEILPSIGLIPLGSGNDLARTLKVSTDVKRLVNAIKENNPRETDVGLLHVVDESGNEHSRYFINECSIGMGPSVVQRINESSKLWGSSLGYLKSIVSTFFSNKPEKIHIKSKNYEWSGQARVLAIANGKAFGHSIYIAPDAIMDDGKLNMFLVGGLPLFKFLTYLQRVKTPVKIDDIQWIDYQVMEKVIIESDRKLAVEADGELVGYTPLRCEVLRKKIKLLV